MNISLKYIASVLVFILLPFLCFAAIGGGPNIEFKHEVLSVFNFAIIIISIIAIKQYFFPKEKNRTNFHVINIILKVIYYTISIRFILSHKEYYHGFETMSDWQCILKFFFGLNVTMLIHLMIIFSFIINILYIRKYRKKYFIDVV